MKSRPMWGEGGWGKGDRWGKEERKQRGCYQLTFYSKRKAAGNILIIKFVEYLKNYITTSGQYLKTSTRQLHIRFDEKNELKIEQV